MPEICKSCNHPQAHHKIRRWWWRDRCRPPKGVDPRKCSCEKYVEDELAKLEKDMQETEQSLMDELTRILHRPKK
jgi:hypothetical protein